MSVEILSGFLFWCAVINYGLLIIWFMAFLLARDVICNIHRKIFGISVEQFNGIIYAGIAFYKILILVLNLIPYIALKIAA